MKTLNMIKTNLLAALIALISIPTFVSCLGNDEPGQTGREVTALVTFEGNYDSRARFTFVPEGDAETKSYIADKALPDDLVRGQRMIIRFVELGTVSNGYITSISLRAYNTIPTSSVKIVDTETAVAANAEIYVNAINRTGKFINLEAYVKNYPERDYTIYADENTVNNEMPDLYITTTTNGDYTGIKNTDIASFDISMVWSRIDCKGVRIHINNTNTAPTKKVFEFKK